MQPIFSMRETDYKFKKFQIIKKRARQKLAVFFVCGIIKKGNCKNKKMLRNKKISKISLALLFLFLLSPLASSAYWDPSYLSGFGLPEGSITGIVVGVLQWVLYLFGFLGILGFAISGIMYLLSAGDDDQMKRAKNAMNYSIIGIIVGLSGVVLMKAIYMILSQGLYF